MADDDYLSSWGVDNEGEHLRGRCKNLVALAAKLDKQMQPAPHPDPNWVARWQGWRATLPTFSGQIDEAIRADLGLIGSGEHDPKAMRELSTAVSAKFAELEHWMNEWEATHPPEDFVDVSLQDAIKIQAGPLSIPVGADLSTWPPTKAFSVGLAAGAGSGLVVLGVRWLLKRPS